MNFDLYNPTLSATDLLKITDELTPCVCSLPIHTEMEEEQLKYITEGVQSFFN
jgi:dTDP-4-amino-4,6-dideoxygalactose transaminase